MSKISEALTRYQQYQSVQSWPGLKEVVNYVLGRDDSALARIRPSQQSQYGYYGLIDALGSPEVWQDEDRRLVRALTAMGNSQPVFHWLNGRLRSENPDQDFHAMVCRELPGLSTQEIAALSVGELSNLVVRDRVTSGGRFILSLSDRDLCKAVKQSTARWWTGQCLLGLLFGQAADRVAAVVDEVLAKECDARTCDLLLKQGAGRFEARVLKAFEAETQPWKRYLVAEVLYAHNPTKYREPALVAARRSLAGEGDSNNHGPVAEWLVANFGKEIMPDLVGYLRRYENPHWSRQVVQHAAKGLGPDALPVCQAGLKHPEESVRLASLVGLIGLRDAAQDALIQQHLEAGLSAEDGPRVLSYLPLAGQWYVSRVEERIWMLLEHKSKPVRMMAARTLARLGEGAVPRAAQLLGHKKADVRLAAAMVLTLVGTGLAVELLEARVEAESNDDVRDQILQGLEQTWESQGRKVTRQDVAGRVARAAGKLGEAVAPWLAEDRLPPLRWTGGSALTVQEVRYLLYRQSRAKAMVADTEARSVYRLIDRSTSGDFAFAVLAAFLASGADAKDRWAMTVAGLLGDDRLVPVLVNRIRDWVDANRGKLAEYAVESLALLATDAALMAVDAMAMRYRNKMKNVGRAASEAFRSAAEGLGITVDELGDRVVPWLGFEPGQPRMIEAGDRHIRVTIGPDFKLSYLDVDRNKPVKTLPKSVSEELQKELKAQSILLREVAKAQAGRLENLMVRQHRWTADRWRQLFLEHPVLRPFGVRLIWAAYAAAGKPDFAFRALEDGTLTGAGDEGVELPPSAMIGMVHPLELDETARTSWSSHLADYEVTPPFPQLERPVIIVSQEETERRTCTTVDGKSLNAMTFKGRAERLGWTRGSVVDAGGVMSYGKSFPEAGADFMLFLDGMFVGIDMYSDVTLRHGYFVKSGSVQTGSYVYDEPSDENDSRVISFGQVPPIVFSEVMGDLRRIVGGTESAE